MSIPHKDRVPHTQIPIATPGELAAALRAKGYPVREQPGRRRPVQTFTALCHGGDSPDKLGLCFDADRRYWTDTCLTEDCDSRAIVHDVQAATELWLWRCDACWSAWRAREALAKPQTVTEGHRGASPSPTGDKHSAGPGNRTGGDTAAHAARLWAAATASTGQAPAYHPVSRWRGGVRAAQRWADQGYNVRIKQLAAGHDPASAPLRERAEDGQTG